ncbi:TPA: transcriptional regulator, partial [Klebsiella quasipneumoniae subsp. similipneumoniae]|nr:transcriptional regulator [Klebsiella quasipneumoniae subsp. similipneumoniae]
KGFSVAPDTLVIPLSDEECENMNRERLTHFHSSKTADVIFNDTGKIDHKLSLPLPVNLAIQENDRRENSVKVAEKVSERLHITFKVPTWLIALIVVMIVINVIVLIVLHR